MKSVINKIFSNEQDESLHYEFIKFGRGVYKNRYLIKAKKQKNFWSIKTSSEFANFLVRKCLGKTSEFIKVKGIIICTNDIEKDIDFEINDVKKYMGIKQYVIGAEDESGKIIEIEIEAKKIIELMEKHQRAFYALSFSVDGNELKIKPKAPKSAKVGTSTKENNNEVKADFCSLKTSDKEIIEDLFFDFPNFNEIKIKHTIRVNEIELPQGVTNPAEIREKAKRKGVLKRIANVDGKEHVKEKEFVA